MTIQTERKTRTIFETWNNGNKKDAATLVRKLNKKELFFLLVRLNEAVPEIVGATLRRYAFENFVSLALENGI